MKVESGTVVREIPWPGCIGDSMRETANLVCMLRKISEIQSLSPYAYSIQQLLNLNAFWTPVGWVRHYDAPFKGLQTAPERYLNAGELVEIKDSWREDDTTGDQQILWYREAPNDGKKAMRSYTFKRFMRYGNGDFIHPGFVAEISNWNWLRKQNLNMQTDLFEKKFRYNEALNKFEPNENSSADYWVWSAIACDFSPKWPAARIGKDILKEKFTHYLKDEPNHEWYLEIACLFADLYF